MSQLNKSFLEKLRLLLLSAIIINSKTALELSDKAIKGAYFGKYIK